MPGAPEIEGEQPVPHVALARGGAGDAGAQVQRVAELLLRDPRGGGLLARRAGVEGFDDLGELLGGEVLEVAGQEVLDAVLGVAGAAAAAVELAGGAAAHVPDGLDGQLHDVEQVRRYLGLRQRAADRGHSSFSPAQRRLTRHTSASPAPWRTSRGRVVTYSCTCSATVPQPGHSGTTSATAQTVPPGRLALDLGDPHARHPEQRRRRIRKLDTGQCHGMPGNGHIGPPPEGRKDHAIIRRIDPPKLIQARTFAHRPDTVNFSRVCTRYTEGSYGQCHVRPSRSYAPGESDQILRKATLSSRRQVLDPLRMTRLPFSSLHWPTQVTDWPECVYSHEGRKDANGLGARLIRLEPL